MNESPGRLLRLFRPRSLAFIGGEPALTALRQCKQLGFAGELWYVHPDHHRSPFASVNSLPGSPDAALVAVNRSATVEVVASLAAIGAGAAICYASGFGEVDSTGSDLAGELLVAAAGMPVVGPNCYGMVSGVTGAALWPDVQGLRRVSEGVAFVTQSGNIAVNLTMQQRGLDVAFVITLGNQIDVGIEECLEVLVADPAVTAVAMHIEALTDVPRFVEAAAAAQRRGLAVVVLKTGASVKGAAIAASHTASMVGDDDAYTALFDRVGARRVHSVSELLDTTNVMSRFGPLKDNRTVSLSCSGGEASIVADRAAGFDLDFCDFADDHRDRIAATLNELVTINNPLDYHTFIWGDRARLQSCFAAVLEGPFSAAMVIIDFPRADVDRTAWWATLDAICAEASRHAIPTVVTASMAENLPAEVIERAHGSGLAAVATIEQALRAIEAVAWWGRPRSLRVRPAGAAVTNLRVLDEVASKALLEHAGVAVPNRHVVAPCDAVAAAEDLCYPVVVKTVGAIHKSDSGGVRIGLGCEAEVSAAANDVGSATVLVESMVTDSVAEILVAVRRSDPVGYLLTVGIGGTLVELHRPRSTILPVSAKEVYALLATPVLRRLLNGYRGRPRGDVNSLVGLIGEVVAVAETNPAIIEIECNPVMATPRGAVVADALITVGDTR